MLQNAGVVRPDGSGTVRLSREQELMLQIAELRNRVTRLRASVARLEARTEQVLEQRADYYTREPFPIVKAEVRKRTVELLTFVFASIGAGADRAPSVSTLWQRVKRALVGIFTTIESRVEAIIIDGAKAGISPALSATGFLMTIIREEVKNAAATVFASLPKPPGRPW